jgi:hypothetical protein
MRHTIVIELPDEIGDETEACVEVALTKGIERIPLAHYCGGPAGWRAKVIEYHHEQMTTTEENP